MIGILQKLNLQENESQFPSYFQFERNSILIPRNTIQIRQ